jgi:hypothetical protein
MQRALPDNTGARPSAHAAASRVIENFIIIWLDSSLKRSDLHDRDSIAHLRQIINSIHVFNDLDQCVAFVHQRKAEKLFIVVSHTLGPLLLPAIHRVTQIQSIFVLSSSSTESHDAV